MRSSPDIAPASAAEAGSVPARAPRHSQEERRGQAEQGLLDAAVALFARRGVDQTSLADIGTEAGYSRGLVNHHFGAKAALVERLAHRCQGNFVAGLGEFDGDEVDALVMLADAYLDKRGLKTDVARAFFVMWGAALPAQAALREVMATGDAQFRCAVESLVRQGQQNDTVTADVDAGGVATVLVGMLRGVTAQFLIDADGVDLAAARTACEQFLRRTLTRRSAARNKRRR
ncbi:MAG: TetR/AcrR family transcriptional regulator [Mycolicibacterium sp.]|nr:TetR/AcrR family transcriptional regulator [Mycolicibacterium sp.]